MRHSVHGLPDHGGGRLLLLGRGAVVRRRAAEDGLGGDRGTGGSSFAAAAGYRHALARVLDGAGRGDPLDPAGPWRTVLWVMLNPSTATETDDDPTIRRVLSFSVRPDLEAAAGGAVERVAVVNLYALRATSPADLHRVRRQSPGVAVGDGTDTRIEAWASRAALVVCAYGSHALADPARLARVQGILLRATRPRHVPLVALGAPTAEGLPRHPLYLPRDAALRPLFPDLG